MIDYHEYWPTDTRVKWRTDWLTNKSTGFPTDIYKGQRTDWLNDSHKYLPTDTRVNWLTDWLTITSIGLLIQGLTDGLARVARSMISANQC